MWYVGAWIWHCMRYGLCKGFLHCMCLHGEERHNYRLYVLVQGSGDRIRPLRRGFYSASTVVCKKLMELLFAHSNGQNCCVELCQWISHKVENGHVCYVADLCEGSINDLVECLRSVRVFSWHFYKKETSWGRVRSFDVLYGRIPYLFFTLMKSWIITRFD